MNFDLIFTLHNSCYVLHQAQTQHTSADLCSDSHVRIWGRSPCVLCVSAAADVDEEEGIIEPVLAPWHFTQTMMSLFVCIVCAAENEKNNLMGTPGLSTIHVLTKLKWLNKQVLM